MSTTFDQTAPAASSTKPLWAAVGALAVVVVGLAGTLIYTQTKTPQASAPAPVAALTPPSVAPVVTAPAAAEKPADEVAPPKPVAKPVVTAPKPAPVHVARKPVPAPTVVGEATPAPAPAPARVVCANCGTIESVTPVEHKGSGSGLGAVAGGVLGAVVGNQVGGGTGRTVATVLGAVGGGYAGNAVEKNMKKTTAYQVQVRMEDGSVRTIEQATAPAVGARVVVDGNGLRAQ
ncbi:glycine zipper 2TM domain-containing protein [Variovorax terrae]|uniref:Glycine zipper 2TM domain-containing protein n=1 Tax=Variovorax terrae TaxID=2923278 RepID=A0A9X1W465_9BURK|nr:glycine zipper 2TM domain-containing protein [Variovorax terrae]MCJ0765488.1 glycine zipper 2TM domain-containing protein [Variovorax terrae]